MFSLIKIGTKFRAARDAFESRDYAAVVAGVADLFELAGSADTAAKLRAAFAAVAAGDAQEIARNALALVADALNAGFGFAKPITVSALPGGFVGPTDDEVLVAECDRVAAICDLEERATVAAAAPDAAAIPPELWAILIEGGVALFRALLERRRARR